MFLSQVKISNHPGIHSLQKHTTNLPVRQSGIHRPDNQLCEKGPCSRKNLGRVCSASAGFPRKKVGQGKQTGRLRVGLLPKPLHFLRTGKSTFRGASGRFPQLWHLKSNRYIPLPISLLVITGECHRSSLRRRARTPHAVTAPNATVPTTCT